MECHGKPGASCQERFLHADVDSVFLGSSACLDGVTVHYCAMPQSRVTEIAAKTLATLAASDSNQTAVRLAGGIPPLMRLLTVRPSEQARVGSFLDGYAPPAAR